MTTTTATPHPLPVVPMWIDGKPYTPAGRRMLEVFNPAHGQAIRQVAAATDADVAVAVAAAKAAFPAWRDMPPIRRARIITRFRELLEQNQEKLARLASEEHGKTFPDAMGSVQRGIEVVEFAQGIPEFLKGDFAENVGTGVDMTTLPQPLGPVAFIGPFNFPVMCPLWTLPIALACGNTFILKPSEKVPSASYLMAELLQKAGVPDGVFNLINGDKEAVNALLQHPDLKAISFVGSTPVAKYIYETAAKNGKRVQALGGAKNHAIVMPDADMDYAADQLIGAGYGSAGERCMAVSAVVAVGDAGDRLVAKIKARAEKLKVGAGHEDGVEMGPVITREAQERICGYIASGCEQGATSVLDGRELKVIGYEEGFFVGPTLFDHVTPDMKIYQDEIFGPVLGVVRVASLEAAIALINASPYANGTAIFTRSGAAARRFQNEIEVGMVGINVPIPVPTAQGGSFGGFKNSLFGDLSMYGMDGVRFYTRTKKVTSRWPEDPVSSINLNMPTLG
jgi:malonate-semialdehyde dehydrogenase (acetylating) / methylmalonate-semialdehyde dehydrogenase